jgi:proline iminopeptidase
MNASGYMSVDGGHSIYYESYGKIGGIPAVILHGGPGGGMSRNSLSMYDLNIWFVVVFDQRGCGKSKPFGKLEHNTTWDLVSDINTLRELFQLERWFVSGRSWGTTLALLYAETYPERVSGLLLEAVCLQDEASQQWKRGYGGASQIFPKEWEKYVELLPPKLHKAHWKEIAKFYQTKLASSEAERYASSWWQWEVSISSLLPSNVKLHKKKVLAIAKLENHYFVHDCWIEEGYIMKHIQKLRDIPITIVHGRYDMVCPCANAIAVADALPQSKCIIHPGSGHSYSQQVSPTSMSNVVRSFTRKYRGKQ